MAETTAKTTTRPRTRSAAKSTAKPAESAPAETSAPDDGTTRVGFTMEQGDDTKGYSKFSPPKSSGCVGNLYVPKGTTQVKVLLIGPAS